MYEFDKTVRDYKDENGTMRVYIVISEETIKKYDDKTRNYCFLYDDITALEFGPKRFIEITSIEVNPEYKLKGVGTKLINSLKSDYPDIPIFVRAGILYEEVYNELETNKELMDYIYKNIVPFYKSNGFVDVNDTILKHEQTVIMCYPESLAQKYIEVAEEAKNKMDEERKQNENRTNTTI